MKFGWWIVVGVVLLSGCMTVPKLPTAQEEGISVQLSYGKVFEKILELLESRGYTVALADEGSGIIETLPKRVKDEGGKIHHKTLLSFLLRGDQAETTVYLRVIVTSDYPDERKEIIESLKALSP